MTIEQAYLAGVLHGDGWCTSLTIGLRVADYEFSLAFCVSLNKVFGLSLIPKQDERGYWLVRTSNKTGKFSTLKSYTPITVVEMAAWVRGMFDSEGNVLLRKNNISENSYGRRIAMYSTNIETLELAAKYLKILDIETRLSETRLSSQHKGDKPVFELAIRGAYRQYQRFASVVGSSIPRKQQILNAIPQTYQIDRAYCKIGQSKGAATKRSRTINQTLPRVIETIRERIQQGIPPLQKNCIDIAGYWAIVPNHMTHGELIQRVQEKEDL